MPRKKLKEAPQSPLDQLRSICLGFPEAHEVEAWGEPTFRVKNKLFAMYASSGTHHGAGRPSVWVKSTPVNQDLLVRWQPARYFVPPYVGPSGWVGVYLDKRPSWKTIADILQDAYLLIAPKKLRAKTKH
ncbi:MAG TPA: MmcQ/YjbR family DNA-binding protein [Gemmatimonadaceae bacterium]|nr:MmcQ/YjbR family DNA-binding protein [Gemmatimonadaceae bacterium]